MGTLFFSWEVTRSPLLPQAGTLIGSLLPESWHRTKGHCRLFQGIYRGLWNFGKQERLSLGPLDLQRLEHSSALVCPPVPTHLGTLLGAPRLLQLQMGNREWRYTVPWPSTPLGQQDCRFNLRMHAQGCQRSLVRRTKTHRDGSCEGSLSSSSSEFEGNCNCMKAARTLVRLCYF